MTRRGLGLWLRCAGALAALLSAATGPSAETVRVARGETDVGAGWLFVHGLDGTCRLATPLHVASRDGVALPTLGIVLRNGRRLDAIRPTAPDAATDLAFYEVTFPRGRTPCTESRLGLDNLAKLLAQTTVATLVSVDTSQIRLREVAIDTADVDQDRGRLFTIRLRGDGEQIQQGMSGSAVMVDSTPLGLLLATSEFDGTLGVVLRFDAIKRLFLSSLAAKPLARPDTAPGAVTMLARGEGLSDAPIADLLSGGAAIIRPTARRAEIELHLPEPRKLRSISVKIARPGPAGSLAVSLRTARGAEAKSAWTPAARCRPAAEAWLCLAGDRTVAKLSLAIVAPDETEIRISELAVTEAE